MALLGCHPTHNRKSAYNFIQSAFGIHNSVSMDSTNHRSCSPVARIYRRKATYKWTYDVQTHRVQGFTVRICLSRFPVLRCIPRARTVNQVVTLFHFLRTHHSVLHSSQTVLIPTSCINRVQFFHIPIKICYFPVFDNSRPSG